VFTCCSIRRFKGEGAGNFLNLFSDFLVSISLLLRTDEHVPLLLWFNFEFDLSSPLVQLRIRSFFFSSHQILRDHVGFVIVGDESTFELRR
jgi:hypothetical protein